MKKLFLLVAIATTISFAACTETKTTEKTEETTIERTETIMEETPALSDTVVIIDDATSEMTVEGVN